MQTINKFIAITCLMFFISLQGCIAILAATAISHAQNSNQESAMTQISAKFDATPDEVYEAAIKVMNKNFKTKIIKKNPQTHIIEAVVGNDNLLVISKSVLGGKTELKVTASSPDVFKGSEHPALDLEKNILKELGVKYKVKN